METFDENTALLTDKKKLFSWPGSNTSRKFYFIMGVLGLLVVIAGFFPTYVSPMMDGRFTAKPFVHLHGAIFFLWILFSISQPFLITVGHSSLHKKLGVPLAFFAAGLVVMGVVMAIVSARVDISNGAGATPAMFLLIPLTDMLLFASFVSLALYYYKKPEYHKRLMLLATVAILPAAFARFFGGIGLENAIVSVLLMNSFVFAGIAYDYFTRKMLHPVYFTGGCAMLAIHFLRIPISQTEAWKSLAGAIL